MQALPIRLLIQTKHTKSATAHTKRRNTTGKTLFLSDIPTFMSRIVAISSPTTAITNKNMREQPHVKGPAFATKTLSPAKKETDAPSQHRSTNQKAVKTQKNRRATPQKRHTATYTNQRRRAIFTNKQHLPHRLPDKKNGLFSRQNSHPRKTYSKFVKRGKNYRFFV